MNTHTEIIPVQISDNVTIMVEADSFGGEEDVGVTDAFNFDEITQTIEAIANSITDTFNRVKPKKAQVELGLKIGVESGKLTTLLVKGSGEANLKITLEWSE
jgi:hypothetical protein